MNQLPVPSRFTQLEVRSWMLCFKVVRFGGPTLNNQNNANYFVNVSTRCTYPFQRWCPMSVGACANTRIKSTRMVTEPWSYWFYWPAPMDNSKTKYTVGRDSSKILYVGEDYINCPLKDSLMYIILIGGALNMQNTPECDHSFTYLQSSKHVIPNGL